MTVDIVGNGPGAAAVEAALTAVDVSTTDAEVDALGDERLSVVVGQVGDTVFERTNERALDAGFRWIAVELGGVGGFPVVNAAVATFGPGRGCYECLSGRVSANLDPQAELSAAPPPHTARFAGAIAGREAARYLLDDIDIFGRVVEIPYEIREFAALPNCACGGDRDRSLDLSDDSRSLEDALARAEQAIDDRLGIVQEIGEAESFPAPYYLAQTCDTAGFSDVTASRNAAGVAAGWDAAFMKALGEGMERYCAGIYRMSEFERGRPVDIEGTVPPSDFVTQFDADRTEETAWVRGEDLSTGERVALPAEFVHYPPPSQRFRSPVTTGLGLGNSGVEALLSGAYEVIERDATMLSWYSTFDPLGLDISDDTYETLVGRAQSEDLSVTPTLVTQDVDVPVVVVAVHSEEWPQFAVGSSAHLGVARAARSALAEALQNWMELRGMGPEGVSDASGAIGRYAEFPQEAEEFIEPETSVPAESVGPDEGPTGEEAFERVLEKFDQADLDAYGVRTTTRDVDELGFEAVRTVVPAAQPLFFDDAYFGARAERVPQEMGFEPALERPHHPFP